MPRIFQPAPLMREVTYDMPASTLRITFQPAPLMREVTALVESDSVEIEFQPAPLMREVTWQQTLKKTA